jgi:hypothetical protein
VPAETADKTDGNVEIGAPPYFHRSDCNICKKRDGVNTGSELLDYPAPGRYIVEQERTFWSSTLPFKSAVPEP